MKKFIVFFLFVLVTAVISLPQNGLSQCTIDYSITTLGLYPHPDSMPCVQVGIPYSEVIQIRVPGNINYQGFNVDVNWIEIDSIGNLPAGLTYACNPNTCRFNGNDNGCILLSGTTTSPPGTYVLDIYINAEVLLFGMPTTLTNQAASAYGYSYELVVINPGDPCRGSGGGVQAEFSWQQGCTNFAIGFVDGSFGNPTTWNWNFGDGFTDFVQNPVHIYSAPGNYTVTLIASDGVEQDTFSTTITVVTPMTVAIQAPDTFCSNLSTAVVVDITGGRAPYNIVWYPVGSANPQNSPTTNFSLNANTPIVVGVSDANICLATDTVQATVIPGPVADPGLDVSICLGESVQIGGASAPNASYSWMPVTGLNDPTSATPTATPATSTTYTLTVDDGNCQSIDAVVVTVNPLPNVTMILDSTCDVVTITPGAGFADYQWSDGSTTPSVDVFMSGPYSVTVTDQNGCKGDASYNVVVVICPGIASVTNAPGFQLVPNPAKGMVGLTLSEKALSNLTVELLSSDGRKLADYRFESLLPGQYQTLDISALPAGVYLVRLVSAEGYSSQKLIIH